MRYLSLIGAAVVAASCVLADEPKHEGPMRVEIRGDVRPDVMVVEGVPGQPGPVLQLRPFRATAIKKEKLAFMGVGAVSATDSLRAQLKLERDAGLVVTTVDADSPAARAGVKPHDVLCRLDDQILINPAQLTALVQSRKPGEKVTLHALRQARQTPIEVTLVEKEIEVAPPELDHLMQTGMPATATRAMSLPAIPVDKRMIVRTIDGRGSTQWSDGEHELNIERLKGQAATLRAREVKSGKEVFNGPVQTPEQRKTVPAEVLKKLERFESTMPKVGVKAERGPEGEDVRVLVDQQIREMKDQINAQRQQLDAEIRWITGDKHGNAVFNVPVTPPRREKVAWLGVSTTPVPALLTEHLRLPRGLGLVADLVDADSPGAKAGLKPNELLLKFEDQHLVNQEQLRALVRMKKPGDAVKLTVIRQGQQVTVTPELAQREVELEAETIFYKGRTVPGTPGVFVSEAATAIPALPGIPMPPPGINAAAGAMSVVTINAEATVTMADDKQIVVARLKDGKAVHFEVRKHDGKELFKGPVETPEQRKALSPELAKQLESLEKDLQGTLQGHRDR